MSRALLIALPALAPAFILAACSSEPTVSAENASVAEVAEKMKGAARLDPGKWQTTVTVISADIPGMPPEMQKMMEAQMKQTQTHDTCVTPEMAEKPSGDLFAGKDSGDCRYEKFEMGGGRLDAVMVCKGQGTGPGSQMRMTMNGTFGGAGYDLTSEMKMAMPPVPGGPQGGEMTMKAQTVGKRIGACA